MTIGVARKAVPTLVAGCMMAACTIAPGPGPEPVDSAAPAVGFGTLRQEDVSIGLTSGDLRVLVTPLHRSVTHVTAPDTERRLNALVAAHAPPGRADGSGLFLVTLYSDRPDVGFVPEDVQLVAQGFRLRASTVTPLTPTWGARRVSQRQQELAVYDFGSGVDLEREIVLEYGLVQAAQWVTIMPRIQAERARVRTRAGLGL